MTNEPQKQSQPLDPELVRKTMAGFEEVNRITAAERRERLRTMTDAEARAIFDDLCATWLVFRRNQTGDIERVNVRRLKEKIAARRTFAQRAKATKRA